MNRNTKKILVVSSILILMTALVLTGCGGKQDAAAGPVEITYWDMVVGNGAYPAAAAEHAKKITQQYPNITIKYESIPWANYYQTFSTAIASNAAPDFSNGGGYQAFRLAAAGEILDVGSIVEEWRADGTLANYQMDMINYFQYEGMQVGIPWNFEPRYFLYRADWFERDGIKVPTTWDEFYAAAEHFTDKANGIYGVAFPAAGTSGNVLWNLWWATNGGGIWTPDGSNIDWINPKNEEALVFVRKLRDAGFFPEGMAAYESNEIAQIAAQEKVAMVAIVGGGTGAQIGEAGLAGKYKILPVFSGPSANGKQGYVAAVNSSMAYKQTDHPTETKQALKWWAENMLELWTNKDVAVNGIPVRNDWLAGSEYQNTLSDPFMGDFIKICLPSTHTLIYPATNVANWLLQSTFDGEQWWCNLSQATLIDTRNPKALLADWQVRSEQLMKDMGE